MATFERWGRHGGAYYGRRWTVWTAANVGARHWGLDQNVTCPADVRVLRLVYVELWTGGRLWFVGRRLRGFDTAPETVGERGAW